MSNLTIDEALRIALDGDAVLFVGAGVGYLVKGPNGPLPNGPTLSNRMLGRPDDAPNPHPLDKAVGHVLRHGAGTESVFQCLIDNLSVNNIDSGLAALYQAPWRRIYTTNYDEAIEKARKGIVTTNSCTLEDGPHKAKVGTVLHINGYLKYISSASIEKGLSLSDRSYAIRNFQDYSWHKIFMRDLETARAVFFVGYSLYDLDISRMIFSANISKKAFFFVSPDVDDVEKGSIELYGSVVDGGAGVLIDAAKRVAEDYTPTRVAAGFVSLREMRVSADGNDNPTRTLDKQLIFGVLPEQQALSAELVLGTLPFVIPRQQQINVENSIRQGILRDAVIVGEFCSGKSTTVLSLCARLFQQGYRVFVAERGATLADELARLSQVDDRVVVVFEGYAGFRNEIRSFALSRNAKHRIFMTEQAIHHEAVSDFIYEPHFAGQIGVIELDRVDRKDSYSFAELVNFGGYWGERAGASIENQANYIVGRLEGSLYKLLLEIIESEDVQRRIGDLLRPVFLNDSATKLFVASCICNVLNTQFYPSDWSSLIDPSLAGRLLNNYRDSLSYFLTVETGRVFPRNGLLSSSILPRVPDRNLVMTTAIDIFSIAARLRTPRDMYDTIHVQMMRFNVIEPILQGSNSKALILKYYDTIRPISDTRNLSDYWLQLGIAATVLDELEIAGDAFDNAYARERKKDRPNLKKIDNYFSRYQLKSSVATNDHQTAYDLFMDGTKGISKQVFLDDNRHYPFKSGRSYGEIASKHYHKWSGMQQKAFLVATRDIRDLAVEWKSKNNIHNVDVEYLIRETGDLLRRIDK